jgi:phosphoesterase RecJ-like protein
MCLTITGYEEIKNILLNNSKNIIITGHINPDADAIGSCIALGFFLKSMNKDIKVVLEEYSTKYDIIPVGDILHHPDNNEQYLETDTLICLDFGVHHRINKTLVPLYKKVKYLINIDHHLGNDNFAQYRYIDDTCSSTSELIYRLIKHMGGYIDDNIAIALYAGIVFDTGGFRHNSTSPDTYRIAAQLLEIGIPFTKIYNDIIHSRSRTSAKVLAKCITDVQIDDDLGIAVCGLNREDMKGLGVSRKDFEGIAEYFLNVEGITISVFYYEIEKEMVKFSLRSKHIDVSLVCNKFGGGGHALASGCTIKKTVVDAVGSLRQELYREVR